MAWAVASGYRFNIIPQMWYREKKHSTFTDRIHEYINEHPPWFQASRPDRTIPSSESRACICIGFFLFEWNNLCFIYFIFCCSFIIYLLSRPSVSHLFIIFITFLQFFVRFLLHRLLLLCTLIFSDWKNHTTFPTLHTQSPNYLFS